MRSHQEGKKSELPQSPAVCHWAVAGRKSPVAGTRVARKSSDLIGLMLEREEKETEEGKERLERKVIERLNIKKD